MTLVQRGGDFVAIEPGCAKLFERSLRAAADGNAGALQNFNTGIEDGALGGAQIRRWRNPLDAGAFEKIVAMPVLHGDDVEFCPDVILEIEKLGQLADRKAVAHRQ